MIFKLVEMTFVKRSFFVVRIMKFVARNSRVASLIQVFDKGIHLIKKGVLVGIVVGTIQPVDDITTDLCVGGQSGIIPDTCGFKLITKE